MVSGSRADQFFGGIAQHLAGCRVDLVDKSTMVNDGNAERSLLHQQAVTRFTGTQGILGAAALIDLGLNFFNVFLESGDDRPLQGSTRTMRHAQLLHNPLCY